MKKHSQGYLVVYIACYNLNSEKLVAAETVQWLNALDACTKYLVRLPSTTFDGSQLMPVIPVLADLTSHFGLHGYPYAYVHTNILTHTY